jgi:hypothetical protein
VGSARCHKQSGSNLAEWQTIQGEHSNFEEAGATRFFLQQSRERCGLGIVARIVPYMSISEHTTKSIVCRRTLVLKEVNVTMSDELQISYRALVGGKMNEGGL